MIHLKIDYDEETIDSIVNHLRDSTGLIPVKEFTDIVNDNIASLRISEPQEKV